MKGVLGYIGRSPLRVLVVRPGAPRQGLKSIKHAGSTLGRRYELGKFRHSSSEPTLTETANSDFRFQTSSYLPLARGVQLTRDTPRGNMLRRAMSWARFHSTFSKTEYGNRPGRSRETWQQEQTPFSFSPLTLKVSAGYAHLKRERASSLASKRIGRGLQIRSCKA